MNEYVGEDSIRNVGCKQMVKNLQCQSEGFGHGTSDSEQGLSIR